MAIGAPGDTPTTPTDGDHVTDPPAPTRYAWYALFVLLLVNIFCYVDRLVIGGVLRQLEVEFRFSETAQGALATAFIAVYAVAAIPFGRLSDLWVRRSVIAMGLAACGLFTMAGALSRSYGELLLSRALVGIGEALCLPSAVALISDLFPGVQRVRAMAIFASGMLLGSGLGIAAGGLIGHHLGWRYAFLLTGAPALLVAGMAWCLREPEKGSFEEVTGAAAAQAPPLRVLLRIPTFWAICAGITLLTGAIGAVMHWGPKFLEVARELTQQQAGVTAGAIAVGGSLLGVLLSAWAGPRLAAVTDLAMVLIIAAGLILATPAFLLFVVSDHHSLHLAALGAAAFFLSWPLAPMGALLHSLVEPKLRATAVAVFVLITHLAGDAVSPPLVGALSDALRAMGLPPAQALQRAMMVLPALCLVGGLVCLLGVRTVRGDMAAMKQRLTEASRAAAAKAQSGQP
ncbi:MAG: spinster family MFS transporter [Armatimonadota bacterium]